jgi:hypothetical protein
MSVQAALILAVALPALGLALYPLVRMGRGRGAVAVPAAPGLDPRQELQEEKLVVYRALFYRGQVLYRAKRDVAGAIRDWERFLELVPRGEERERIVALLGEARQGQPPR